jgi:hypothetical protein
MTTSAFQIIFDKASSIAINKKAVTAQTISRDNTVRAISRGGNIWRFDVKMPDGLAWSDIRGAIEAIDHADRFTAQTIQLNNPGYSQWLTPYLGSLGTTTGFTVTATQGSNQLTMTATPASLSTGYYFKAGDVIQLGTGRVYSVVNDVPFNATTITVNRPVLDVTGTYSLVVGPDVTWNVLCVNMPQWTIFAPNRVSWNGSFSFYEALV